MRNTGRGRDYRPEAPSRALRRAGYGLAAWSFAFLLPHLYWALGGPVDPNVIRPSPAQLAQLREINWWASLVLAAATLLGMALVWCRDRPVFRWPLLGVAWAGASVALAHGVYGIGARAQTVLQVTAGPSGFVAGRDGWLLWDLLLFEPWFFVEGLLIVLAVWHFLSGETARRRWLLASLAGASLAFAAAVAQIRVG